MQVRGWLRASLSVSAVMLLLVACDFSGPQSAMSPRGPIAQQQWDLFMWTYWLSLPVIALVVGALIYALYKARIKSEKDAKSIPHQTHGNTNVEIVWTLIPVILVVLVAVPTVRTIFATEQIILADQIGPDDVVVHARGQQWWFAFEYPEYGVTTSSELIIPAGRRVIVQLESADVLHSFWVPNLAGKRDMIPNQDNQVWFIADEPGVYYGQCAEHCLGAHAYMRFRVIAYDDQDFDAWVQSFQVASQQPIVADPLVQRGHQLAAAKGCVGCHTIDGYMAGVNFGSPAFPNLTNYGLRTTIAAAVRENTPENLADWLRDPQALKPGNRMPTLWQANDPNREEEIEAIVAYLLSLGTNGATQGGLHVGGQ